MSTIPEAAVEAARQAFGKHAEWRYRQNWNARGTCICGETLPEKGNIHREFGYHQMTKVLEAAAPIIRADERQRIAEEIRAYIAEYRHAYALPGNPYAEGFMTGLEAFSEAHLTERNGK